MDDTWFCLTKLFIENRLKLKQTGKSIGMYSYDNYIVICDNPFSWFLYSTTNWYTLNSKFAKYVNIVKTDPITHIIKHING